MNTTRTNRETVAADWTSGELGGRAALVTGGGIGAAICIALAEQGACIAAGCSRDEEQAWQMCNAIEVSRVQASAHHGKVGLADDRWRVVREAIEQHGRPDISRTTPVSPAIAQ